MMHGPIYIRYINKHFPTRQSEEGTVFIHIKKIVGTAGIPTLESDFKNQSN